MTTCSRVVACGVPDLPDPLEQLTLAELRTRTSTKWREHPPDVLPLWVAEMDVLLAEPVQRVLHDAVARGDTGYPAGTGYAEALAVFAAQRWAWDDLDVARTAVVPDVMLGIVEALELLTSPGDTVVVNCPVYPPFYGFLEWTGLRVREAPLTAGGRLDLAALAEAFGDGAAAYLLCNPHNPTGTVHTAQELSAVAALADEHGVRVVSDEIHAPLVLPGAGFVPYLCVPGAEDAFAVLSATKGWNLAGLKAALLVAGPGAAADLARLPEVVSHGPSHVGVLAHTAALADGGPWLDALLAGLDAKRTLLRTLLDQHLPGARWTRPEATYLAWLDCRALGLDDGDGPDERGLVTSSAGPAGVFLREARVALSAGPAFGTGGAGHVRLNYATSREVLEQAVVRMGGVAAGHA
jgi:cystathionine beta-lyase